ncbi:DUF2270 domain-containing protein [Geoalkalibacter halelectricus]|uniref:DUF2270 domain-containing protein n=1 Tax=Geoalkalibacter halelectricus TaxID=2847045 RepID=A0ABY5ZFM9_9BACT|nr:DUF2270 domain-containing protein [Geoalkalibacter halelectricus]MDO3377880.1 DUF2270 domain-containing protein [Geoalkalibacter halelectricus]UWZ77937.1 DUF2270 domain-containing protein [Geoalkalibacter halelectricus]
MALDSKDGEKLSRGETITALVHYYRAEVTRSLAWRTRLDRTTNWAVGTTAAFLGFGFSHPEITHAFFLFGIAIAYILLFVEARRYRFYDAYEYRVRLLNQNFIYGVLNSRLRLEEGSFWLAELASDLRYPQYKMPRVYALGRRIYSNYIYLFLVLIAGWLFKIKLHPVSAESWEHYLRQAALGMIPGWCVLLFILVFFLHLLVFLAIGRRKRGGRDVFFGSQQAEKKKRNDLEET